MTNTKIVIIGAGSASFGLGMLSDAVNMPELRGSTVTLVDIDADALEAVAAVARKMNEEAVTGLKIEHTTDRTKALPGAEFVIVSVAVDRNERWKLDFRIPLKHGIRQVLGENGGPGGLFHSMRNIPIILDICHDIERLCPDALVLNLTNPVPRVCMAVDRYTDVSIVGLCHGIGWQLSKLSNVMGVPADNLDAKAAGLNHFTWILDMRLADTGKDAYPVLREKLKGCDPGFDPLCRKMFETFGCYPSPSDDHIGEYLPFAWEYCGDEGYDFDAADRHKKETQERIARMVCGDEPVTSLVNSRSGERPFSIIHGILANTNHLELAVNIPNNGHIDNLPSDAVVEVPALISGAGVSGISIGSLPSGIASLCNTQVGVQELVVQAAVTGSRQTALQALLADPVVHTVEAAEKTLDELLAAHAAYLPQFR